MVGEIWFELASASYFGAVKKPSKKASALSEAFIASANLTIKDEQADSIELLLDNFARAVSDLVVDQPARIEASSSKMAATSSNALRTSLNTR